MRKQILEKIFRLSTLALITAIILNMISLPAQTSTAQSLAKPGTSFFLENKGQTDQEVAYYGTIAGGTVYIEKDGQITYKLNNPSTESYIFKEQIQSDKTTKLTADNRTAAKYSSFIGENTVTDIPAYQTINLGEIADHVSAKLETKNGSIEKIFTVEPTGDTQEIQIKVDGIDQLTTKDGKLELITLNKSATYSFTKPVAYQIINNQKKFVRAEYKIINKNTYGFNIGDYNQALPLIIDPLLGSTYLGGSGTEYTAGTAGGNSQMIIANSSVYVTGSTDSLDFPTTTGPYGPTGDKDIFITRYDLDVTTVLASTLIGSSGTDDRPTITVDNNGNIIMAGNTTPLSGTSDYPVTAGAYDETFNGLAGFPDVVISKFSADLSTHIAATFLGGAYNDVLYSVATNSSGQIYVAGTTSLTKGSNFPITPGTMDDSARIGGNDIFIARFNNDLSATGYTSTYFHVDPLDPAITIGPAPNEYVYITGRTANTETLGTSGAYQQLHGGGTDNFIASITGDLTTEVAFSYFGGTNDTESIANITTDGTNIIISADEQSASDLNTAISANPNTTSVATFCPGGLLANCTSKSLAIAKFPQDLSSARVAIIGANDNVLAGAVATDSSNNVFVSASTMATNFPTTNDAYSETDPDIGNNYSDIIIAKFSSTLEILSSSTYFGGSGTDIYPYGLAIDSLDNVFVNGQTDSSDLTITSSAPQATYGGNKDFFITSLSNDLSAYSPNNIIDLAAFSNNESIDLSWSEPSNNGAPITSYIVEYKQETDEGWYTCEDSSCTDSTPGANVPGLTNWETYYFRVFAVNDTGTSPASNIVTAIPTPCGSLADNDDQTVPGSTISQSCVGATVLPGDLYFDNIPDSFSFPQKFYSQTSQIAFSNDDPTTRTVTDISTAPDDVLTVADLRNDPSGFFVTITSSEFSDGVNTIPLSGLHIATSCPEYFAPGDSENDLDDNLYSNPLTCDNMTGVEFADGSIISSGMNIGNMVYSDSVTGTDKTAIIQAFEDDGLTFDAGPINIMHSIGSKVSLISQVLNFYLEIPVEQPPGNYSVLFTLDLTSALVN